MRVSWRRVAALAALVALVPTAAYAAAKPSGTPCGRTDGLRCLTVAVPLDRSGRVPGTVSLHVEVLPAEPQRGVLFLVAGGPGQGSADVFELGVPEYADDFRDLAPATRSSRSTTAARASGQLHCRCSTRHPDAPAGVAACAKTSAPARLLGTADHAEDLEAVRRALGYRSIALFGVSYGTKLVLSYALAHPGRVERLLLDSVSLPEGDNPFLTDFFSRFPHTLARFCAGGSCRGVTADFPGEVAALANDLAAKPIRGEVRQPGGGSRTEHLGGNGFRRSSSRPISNPALAAELPALVHAARRPGAAAARVRARSGGSAGCTRP
jgi:pimeloyl-ACP methyl ester carboxylesterase